MDLSRAGRRSVVALLLLGACAAPSTPGASRTAPAADAYITAREAVAWPGRPYDARMAYGPAPQQYGELRLPGGAGPHPVAVVLHGGCWLSLADNDYMDPVAEALTAAGWATWNLEFRTLDQPGGGWPGTLQDVGAGMDALRSVAAEYPLDLERVVTVGHSSGGHLALWAAARHNIDPASPVHASDPLRVQGVIGLAAIADVAHYHAMQVPACGDTPERLLGGRTPSEAPEILRAVSPADMLLPDLPRLLVTGVDDYAVPPAHGQAYTAAMRARGEPVEHHVLERANHFEVVAPHTPVWAEVWARVGPFLEQVGRTPR